MAYAMTGNWRLGSVAGCPLVHTGPVLTGDKVIVDGLIVADLRGAWPNAIGGYAAFRVI